MRILTISAFIFALLLAACSSKPPKPDDKYSIDVARVLKQVNDAVEASIDPKDKDFPPISSVTLDLQVTVTDSFECLRKAPH